MEPWLNESIQWWHWMLLGIILAGGEMLVPSFFLLWIGISAMVVGSLLLLFPLSVQLQLLLWGALSLICLITWFKFVAPKMRDKSKSGMALEALRGQVGTVLSYNEGRGQLRFPAPLLGEDEWHFFCDAPVNVGDKVRVSDTSGNALVVSPVNS